MSSDIVTGMIDDHHHHHHPTFIFIKVGRSSVIITEYPPDFLSGGPNFIKVR